VHDQILKILGGPTAEEAGAAAGKSAPVNAYRQSMLRDLEKQRAGAAEMAGLTGTDASGGLAGTIQGLKQATGEATAKYAGEYTERAMAARRQELQQALQMAQQQGNFEDTQALQAEIARVDAEIRNTSNANQRYATEVQKLLGMSDTELRRYLGEMQNATNRYGIDVGAGTAAGRLDLDWWMGLSDDQRKRLEWGINGPK